MQRPEPDIGHPLWSLGFRPFFLLGAAFALLAVLIWLSWLFGAWSGWQVPGGMLAWHRHEMPFGFATAIIAGFLLTAVPNWTGLPALSGRPLMLLVVLWTGGRLAWLVPLPAPIFVLLQLAFLPALAWTLARPLFKTKKYSNYPIVLIVALMSALQGLTLWGVLHHDDELQRRGVLAALWLIAGLMTVIGGRVIPFFIRRGLSRAQPFPPTPRLDKTLLLATLLVAASQLAGLNVHIHYPLALLYGLLVVLHVKRLLGWHDRGIWRVPLLWSLYLAYGWIVIAAIGMAAWHLGIPVQQTLATHALSVGGVGGMILAMLARVSLGHTGRPLSPHRHMSLAFAAINLGALCRVAVVPFSTVGLWMSGVFWLFAFVLFLLHYTQVLCRPRAIPYPV